MYVLNFFDLTRKEIARSVYVLCSGADVMYCAVYVFIAKKKKKKKMKKWDNFEHVLFLVFTADN